MAYEAAAVKEATHIRLYCHLAGHMDGDLKPIPVTIELQEIDTDTYKELFYTNFLEYNKITLADKNQQFTVPESVIACKVPEHFLNKVGFAVKLFLPPHLEKIEFLDGNGEVLYTKYFSLYNDENILVEPDVTYSKWFIYSLAEKLLLNDEQIPEETYCFEYDLHKADTNAHAKDIVSLPMQLDNRSLASKNSIYYALYTKETEADSIKAKAQVINGNLITNDYRLFYLGNNIYDNTDEINEVASWADNQRNSDGNNLVFNGAFYTAGGFMLQEQALWQGALAPIEPIAQGEGVLAVPSWGTMTQYMIGTGNLDTSTNGATSVDFSSWSRSGTALLLSGNDYDHYSDFSDVTTSDDPSKFQTIFTDENGNQTTITATSIGSNSSNVYLLFAVNFTDSPFSEIRLNINVSNYIVYRLTLSSTYQPNTNFPTNSTFGSKYWNSDLTMKQNCKITLVRKH